MKQKITLFIGCFIALSTTIAFGYTETDCINAQILSGRGVINSQRNCSGYKLDRTITRQEAATVALRVAEICGTISDNNNYRCENIFDDVTSRTPNTWLCETVETLARNNIISENDKFYPSQSIKKAEAMSLIFKS